MINRLAVPMSWQTHLKTLWNWVPQSLMTEWRASKRVKRHCMNFTTAFALLAFALYNLSASYAWNLYSSNSSSWYFLSKDVRLASIFSRFIAHNGLCSRLTYKWQDLPLNSRQGEVSIDTSLEGSWKGPKSLIELDWPIPQRLIDRLSKN